MRRRIAPAFGALIGEPISDLNTTPLIDVMLVLLIMFIVTIPIVTHKVSVDSPGTDGPAAPDIHLLDLDVAGGLHWDGARINEADLPARLTAMQAGGPEAVLHFRADGESRYEDFDRVLATVKRAGVERLGLIGNERFAGTALR